MALFFFNDTATTEIYTLSLHDALPIYVRFARLPRWCHPQPRPALPSPTRPEPKSKSELGSGTAVDRKSTRLNSSHSQISYAVFCLKKKKKKKQGRPDHNNGTPVACLAA